MKIFYCLVLVMIATFFLGIGLRVLLRKKPIFMHGRWFLILIALAFSPAALNSLILLGKVGLTPKASILMLNPIMYVIIILMFWFSIKGYTFIGIRDDYFREGLHTALNKLNIKFEETLARIKLLEYNSELQIAIQPWLGTAQVRLKGIKDKELIKSILNEIDIFFKNKEIKTNKIIPIFYLILGVLMFFSMIAILLLTANKPFFI